jgi:2-oxoglutarate ferredoxin oxidoreductase subunit beta
VQTKKDYQSPQEVRWCPGCGDFAILAQVQKLLPTMGLPRENHVFVSGIGCSSRFPYYMNTYGFHSIHGRAPAIATGVKCANPELTVWVVTGDGDGLSIGTNHLIHCLRRNMDVKILLLNNRIYGLTKGQYSPTSELGKKTKSSPLGTIEQPIRPVQIALAAEAIFVARTVFADPNHMGQVLERAARHKGAAFVEILQLCRVFNDDAFDYLTNRESRDTSRLYLEHGKPIRFGAKGSKGLVVKNLTPRVVDLGAGEATEGELLVHDEKAQSPALGALLAAVEPPDFPTPLGVFRDLERPTYDGSLMNVIGQTVARKGRGDLGRLFRSDTVWQV